MMNLTNQWDQILLVIPSYNHGKTLRRLLDDVLIYPLSVLVVDDGSDDKTCDFLKPYEQKISVIRHHQNQGKGAALRSAFSFALEHGYRAMITIDADGQHFPQDLPALMDMALKNPDSIVIGSRDMNSPLAGRVPGSSKFGRKFSNFWVWIETGYGLSDTQSGYRVYPVTRGVLANISCDSYQAEIEVLVNSLWDGLSPVEVPVRVWYPPDGQRISHFRPFLDNFRLTKLHTLLCLKRILGLIRRDTVYKPQVSVNGTRKELGGARFLGFFIRVLGIRLSYGLAIFPLMFFFIKQKKSRQALSQMYSRLGHHKGIGSYRLFRNFVYFGFSILDRIRFSLNPEVLSSMICYGRIPSSRVQPGAIFVGAHYGDWMLCGMGLEKLYQLKMALVVNQAMTPEFLRQIRANMPDHTKLISPLGKGLEFILELKELIEQGYCLGFMVDRPDVNKNSWTLNFLGKPGLFSSIPFRMAEILDAPVYSFICRKTGFLPSSDYELVVDQIRSKGAATSAENLAKIYLKGLEKSVKNNPSHWFNFVSVWS